MALYLEVLDGEQKGKIVRIRKGLRIGRTMGDLIIKDPKMSSLHAQVESNIKDRWVLVDRNSSNGMRINGSRVARISLLPGVTFQIGKTYVKVLEGDNLLGPETEEESAVLDWVDILKQEIPRLPAENIPPDIPVRPFNPAIKLKFIEGLFVEKEMYIGFGPRAIGSSNLDIEIPEQMSPPIAFELIPDNEGVQFITSHNKLVLLNGMMQSDAQLAHGDLIRIGETLILVEFL